MSRCAASLATAATTLGIRRATLWIRDENGTVCAQFPSAAEAPAADERFVLGCLVKPITATLVMQLVESGGIALDASIASFFPELRCEHGTAAITVRDLLRHTSGLDGSELEQLRASRPTPSARAANRTLDVPERLTSYFPAGRHFSYGNSPYQLLANVLEQWYDLPFDAIVQRRIFDPLGLSPVCGDGAAAPSAQSEAVRGAYSDLRVSADELLTVFGGHDGRLPGHGGSSLLSASTANAMRTRQVNVAAGAAYYDGWTLGWGMFGDKVLGHNSHSGDVIAVRLIPETSTSVVLRAPGGRVLDLAVFVIEELFGIPPPSKMAAPASGLDTASIAGAYRNHYWELRIEQTGKGLRGHGAFRPFYAPAPFEFTMTRLSERRFVMNIDDGRAKTLVSFVDGGDRARSAVLWDGQQLTPKIGCLYQ